MRIDAATCRDPDLLAAEIRRLQRVIDAGWTLTDAEREAVALMAEVAADPRGGAVIAGHEVAATLRGLLERTK